jgi:DNA-binding transcriptional regulator YhcF (GntR family)
MAYQVDVTLDVPPSRQLVEQVLDEVASGRLAPGAQLPSVRALAAEALVNPNTAARAVRDLEQLGVAVGRNGLGVFVSEEGPAIARARRGKATLAKFRQALSEALRAGHPPELLADLVDAAAAQVAAPRGEKS